MVPQTLTIELAGKAGISLTDGHVGHQALHDVLVALRANRRAGTAHTKRRGEVQGSGKKLWNQKGTGNARMGSRRSPIWSGGATVFGPRSRDFSKVTTKKVRTLALRKAVTERIRSGDASVLESFQIADGKTKTFVSTIQSLTNAHKVVIVGTEFDISTRRSARNVQNVQLFLASDVTAEDLLNCDKVLVTSSALPTLASRTA